MVDVVLKTLAAAVLALTAATPALAQLESRVVVSGLSSPVAFVQDPSLSDTRYVVQQGGRIRVVRNGQLVTPDFLDLTSAISSGGERGLLGLAFAPDDTASGRVFVNFTNPNGDTVIARFTRSAADPRRADASTRFDLRWPDGNRFIAQPFSNHNGGNLQFGPDGDLYIGLGDGGDGNDPAHRAQDPATLLGKMVRINVNVSNADPEGYDVPADNPFVGRPGYLAEIWAFGLRNPWRYSFDAFGTGATGALVIGDVGQNQFEEVDYEPAGRGGRNYGWRNREGAHDNVTSRPVLFQPLTDPIYDYSHAVGATVIGGYVYRGGALPAAYRGRYFFADFVASRVWSMTLAINSTTGDASMSALEEHTTALGGTAALGGISSFGIDGNGELYLVSLTRGEIRVIAATTATSNMAMSLDVPVAGAVVQPFVIGGWAVDLGETRGGPGVDTVHLWAQPSSGSPAVFLGASSGAARPDVATLFGSAFLNSGFGLTVSGLPAGAYRLIAYAHSTVTGGFDRSANVDVTVAGGPTLNIDTPAPSATVPPRFSMAGWAIDRDSLTGTGVDTVHVWAYPQSGAAQFVGAAAYGTSRPDVGAAFGSRFTNAGWGLTVTGLAPGAWTLVAYLHSTVTGTFRISSAVAVQVQSGLWLQIDVPVTGAVTAPFQVAGWALDLAAPSGSGVSAIHVWAQPIGGTAELVGAATLGASRPDVGVAFGSQFASSGYTLTASLAAGTYDVIVYAQSSVTGRFDLARVVRVTVR